MERKNRNYYTPEQKIAILKRHLLDKVPVSDQCDEYHMQTTVFYRWLKQFFENGAAAFERKRPGRHAAADRKIAELENKLKNALQSRDSRTWTSKQPSALGLLARGSDHSAKPKLRNEGEQPNS